MNELLEYARSQVEQWRHLGFDECLEQVDAHIESNFGCLTYGADQAVLVLVEYAFGLHEQDAEAEAIAAGRTWPGRTCAADCGYCGACT